MNSLFKMLQESFGSAPSRNGFDLSRRDIFSTKAGFKLPVLALPCVPQDYHEIRPVNLIRTQPMNVANFTRIKQHVDYYFVPYSFLQSNFNEVIQQTTDPVSSLLAGQDMNKSIPTIKLYDIICPAFLAYLVDIGDYTWTELSSGAAFEYATIFYGNCFAPNLFMQNFLDVAKDMFGFPIYQGAIRLLDMLGYGNFLSCFSIKKDDFKDPSGELTPEGEADYLTALTAVCDALSAVGDRQVNLYNFLAYQCIYQNFGINTTYDKLDVFSYNIDDIVANTNDQNPYKFSIRENRIGQDPDSWENLRNIFTLRYSQWKKDIFTSLYPDSQFGSVSVVSINTFIGESLGTGRVTNNNVLTISPVGEQISYVQNSTTSLPLNRYYSQFSVLDLRRAEALQGWKEDMMRSGFRARQRQKSQFGVSPRMDLSRVPDIIGSITSNIDKDVVTGTSGAEFAEQASHGTSTMGDQVLKYSCDDYGVIIGVMTILPEADYDAFGIDMSNIKSEPFDFYTPAFQNIGLQAVPRQYLNLYNFNSSSPIASQGIVGYAPRYFDYKQAFDKVHGEFSSSLINVELVRGSYNPKIGSMRSYVSTRDDMEVYGLTSLASLYVNPSVLDDIFALSSDSEDEQSGYNPGVQQNTDQFHVNMYHDIKSVRPMSVLGLPRF